MTHSARTKPWTIAEAKARLSEILRLAAEEGPQVIGTRRAFVVVAEEEWRALSESSKARPPLGSWLLDNMPRGAPLEPPSRDEPDRATPFDFDPA